MFKICFEMRGFPGDSDAKEVEEVAVKVISRLQSSVSDQNRVMIIICDIIMEILPLAAVVKVDEYQSLIFRGNADVTKADAGERYHIPNRGITYYHNNSSYEIGMELNMKPYYTQSPRDYSFINNKDKMMFDIRFEMRGFPLESKAEEASVNVTSWITRGIEESQARDIIMEILPLATVVKKDRYQSLVFMGNAEVTKAKAGESYHLHLRTPYYYKNGSCDIEMEMNMKPYHTLSQRK